MRTMGIYILMAAFFFLSGSASEKTILTGKVTVRETGDPVIFANVALYKQGKIITGAQTDFDGLYEIKNIDPGTYDVEVTYVGLQKQRIVDVVVHGDSVNVLNVEMQSEGVLLEMVEIKDFKVPMIDKDNTTSGRITTKNLPVKNIKNLSATTSGLSKTGDQNIGVRGSRQDATKYYVDGRRIGHTDPVRCWPCPPPETNTEEYEFGKENAFQLVTEEALTTFSIDVDRASYSNIRRFINNGSAPPADAVRIEEMVNYFDYGYEGPNTRHPFAVRTQLVSCPWNEKHQILHVAMKGKEIKPASLPPSNFVFLMDVSGSMGRPNKLPLVKESLKMLLGQLQKDDRIAIVVYAGAAGCVLESTPVSEKGKILDALDKLNAGGSTAGGAGIELAYKKAEKNFIKEGNNRVILTTDGDFNVGVSSPDELEKLIEKKRKSGVFLSVLGYGTGNVKDNRMQRLADKGNGNHAYIDNIQEARKVFVSEMTGTLHTIAKDVKIQIEFNPHFVQAYRLIGYENRMLAKEDFNNDAKDAGELGAGHSVTALYEIVPAGVESQYVGKVDPLKYQKNEAVTSRNTTELGTIKMRYKLPDEDVSTKLEQPIDGRVKTWKRSGDGVRFAMAVAEFGMLLKDSDYRHEASFDQVVELASNALNHDPEGYRAEFVRLVKSVQMMEDVVEK